MRDNAHLVLQKTTGKVKFSDETSEIISPFRGGFRGGGAHPARAPPKIGKNMIFLQFLIQHT
jgi:hypothetical protein